jgi:hypothetical protein
MSIRIQANLSATRPAAPEPRHADTYRGGLDTGPDLSGVFLPTREEAIADMLAGKMDAVARAFYGLTDDMVTHGPATATGKTAQQIAPHVPVRKTPAKKPSTVTGSFLTSAPKTAIPDRKTLLAELANHIGGGMAHRYRNKTAEQLMDVLAKIKTHSPRDVGASWDAAFAKRGVEVSRDAKVSPNATRREEIAAGWDRALKRMGAKLD